MFDITYEMEEGHLRCKHCALEVCEFNDLMKVAEVEISRHYGQVLADEHANIKDKVLRNRNWEQLSKSDRTFIETSMNANAKIKKYKSGAPVNHWMENWKNKWDTIRAQQE